MCVYIVVTLIYLLPQQQTLLFAFYCALPYVSMRPKEPNCHNAADTIHNPGKPGGQEAYRASCISS